MTTLDPPDSCNVDQSEPPKTTEPLLSSSFGWFQSTMNQSTEIWSQIKRDISDVAKTVMSNNQLAAAKETASTVYRQVCETVQSGSADPPPPTQDQEEVIEEIDTVTIDVDAIKSTLSGMLGALERSINEMVGSNISFGLGSSHERTPYNREACIEIIKADPATFEKLPPDTQDVLSYEDWRQTFFDPNICAPRNNMPVFVGRSIPLSETMGAEEGRQLLLHSVPPARVLDESPIVRQHFIRLVDPSAHQKTSEVSPGVCGITEADFWSRYYYRVWCLDVQEARRRQMSEGEHLKVDELNTAAWPVLETNDDEISEGAKEQTRHSFPPKPQTSPPNRRLAEAVANLSSPSSSVVIVNSDDEENDSRHSSNSAEETLSNLYSGAPSGESGGKQADYEDPINLSAEDLKESEIDLKKDLNKDDPSEGSDWENWT